MSYTQQPYDGYPPQSSPLGYQRPPPGPPQNQYPPPGQYPPQNRYPPTGYTPPQPQQGYPPQSYPAQQPLQAYPPPSFSQNHSLQQPPQAYPPPGYPPQQPLQAYPPPQGYRPQEFFSQQSRYDTVPYGSPQTALTPPSPGYIPGQIPQGDASVDADICRKAMKGFGTDEPKLIQVLTRQSPLQIALLKETYSQRHKRSLEADVKSETSSYFQAALLGIVRGPLMQDVHNLNKAVKGLGTKESLLNDVLIARSNADIHAIKQAYQQTYRQSLEDDVRGDLSGKTERLFQMILAGNREEDSTPVIPQQVEADITELHSKTEGRAGAEALAVCALLSHCNDGHIRAIAQAYHHKYCITLEEVLEKEFSGHMKQVLVQMVRAGVDRAMRDAKRLEETMAGMGTKDELLVARVVELHWNRQHLEQVKGAYKHQYHKDLVVRIKGETSGDYMRTLVAMVE